MGGTVRRLLALWLPDLAIDRLRRTDGQEVAGRPLVLTATASNRQIVLAADPVAEAAGITVGQPLADARTLEPGLIARPADPGADAAFLDRLGQWATRFTPWAAPTGDPAAGEAGLLLDVTGCAHLFGGEVGLLRRATAALARGGLTVRGAIADTVGAAWAVARSGTALTGSPGAPPPDDAPIGPAIVMPTGTPAEREAVLARALDPLPPTGLRLPPAVVTELERLGLRRIGQLRGLPRGSLARRFERPVLDRLDQAFGAVAEPITPRRPPPRFHTRLGFAEPIGRTEDVTAALDRLLDDLCGQLAAAGRGARRLILTLYRVDGLATPIAVGTSRPNRDATALARLFRDRLDGLDAGFGFEVIALVAAVTDPVTARQDTLDQPAGAAPEDLAGLVDRLSLRLGDQAVFQAVPRPSHQPERAIRRRSPRARPARARSAERPAALSETVPRRPVRLFDPPRPIEVTAPVPDDPPLMFRWDGTVHRVVKADGPERIGPDWWRDRPTALPRDYYHVEDTVGRRFWLFRDRPMTATAPARWYLQGLGA